MPEFPFYNLEWLAGLFDGEGSVSIGIGKYARKDGSRNFRLIVQLVQKNKRLLLAFKQAHGGCVSVHGGGCHTWRLEYRDAQRFLENIWPYLVLKQNVALLALRFCTIRGDKYRRKTGKGRPFLKSTQLKQERLRNKIMRLNAKD